MNKINLFYYIDQICNHLIFQINLLQIIVNFVELPWDQPSTNCLEFMNWKENDYWSSQTPWSKLDNLVITFLRRVLSYSPAHRLTIAKILEHKWCQMQFNDSNNGKFYLT